MTSSRHLLSDDLWDKLELVSRKLGYKTKGEKSKEILLDKLLDFANLPENSSRFFLS